MNLHRVPLLLAACLAVIGCFASVADLEKPNGAPDAGVGATSAGGSGAAVGGGMAGAGEIASGGASATGGVKADATGGTGPAGGGAAGAAGDCKDPTGSPCGGAGGGSGADCQDCMLANCKSELMACYEAPECKQLIECASTCADQACLDACAASNPPAGGSAWWAIVKCAGAVCTIECQSGGGTSGVGGFGTGGAAGANG